MIDQLELSKKQYKDRYASEEVSACEPRSFRADQTEEGEYEEEVEEEDGFYNYLEKANIGEVFSVAGTTQPAGSGGGCLVMSSGVEEESYISWCMFCGDNRVKLQRFMMVHLHEKYFEAFNFYFAKGVNEILANIMVSHVILFRDYLFYDDDAEYLKRVYHKHEFPQRFKLLTDFYAYSYKPVRPNLCVVSSARTIQKRDYKSAKLFVLAQQAKAEAEE